LGKYGGKPAKLSLVEWFENDLMIPTKVFPQKSVEAFL